VEPFGALWMGFGRHLAEKGGTQERLVYTKRPFSQFGRYANQSNIDQKATFSDVDGMLPKSKAITSKTQ